MDKISTATTHVTIKVIQVAGKRMTLSVFRQVPRRKFIESEIAGFSEILLDKQYIGWVADVSGDKFILFKRDEILWKSNIYSEVESSRDEAGRMAAERNHQRFLLPEFQCYISI